MGEVGITRFEQEFYKVSDTAELRDIRLRRPFFFNQTMTDDFLMGKLQDKKEQRLFHRVSQTYPSLEGYRKPLKDLFRHVKYYYPKFSPPRVFSYISTLDYPYDVVYADSLMFISLDFFLGKDVVFYQGFPKYISHTFEEKYLMRQVTESMVRKMIVKGKEHTFLDGMIYEGKKILLLHALMPHLSEDILMKYDPNELQWCEKNEKKIWTYFVTQEIFYKSYKKEAHRFLKEGPFSKFYLDIDRTSPGRVGVWIGYKVLRSFMEQNPEVPLMDLIDHMDGQEIFRKSGYKPED